MSADVNANANANINEPTGPNKAPSFLVVLGSSAGGIEALMVLLGSLPKSFPAPIVVAQHVDPQRPSSLAAVLERKSPLPVHLVEGTMRLEGGAVYVVPSNKHVTIRDQHVSAEDDHQERPRPSVDLLLSSAAEAYGEQLVAVILTGAGSDGASGALEVKRHGGTVIIQNPATARFPSMPLALPPTVVDHVADIENLGALLDALVHGVELPKEEGSDGVRKILALVSASAGVDFSAYKPSTILRRIGRRMVVLHQTTLEEYGRFLEQHPEEVHRLAMAFLIKVTEFFRDEDAFEVLREKILPMIVERARQRGRSLRIWSAGCATGEEPYSLAMLVADMLGAELAEWNIRIFATDLDEGSIAFARRGLYPERVLAKVPPGYRQRFFEATDSGLQVSKLLRQIVIFGQQDISRGVAFPRIDLAVCRNLLIYFKPELQEHVLDLFAYSLSQTGGYLFLGKAETARPSSSSFDLVDKRWKVYRCTKPNPPLRGRRGGNLPAPFAPERSGQRAVEPRPSPEQTGPGDVELLQLRRFNELLLRVLPTGVAVVDRQYRLLTINQTARRMLGIRELGHELDFLHAARGLPYAELRDALDTVFRERSTVTLSELHVEGVGTERYLTLCLAFNQYEPGGDEVAIISATDATDGVQGRHKLESIQSEQNRLVGELTTANKRLSDMNKDLQDANEELQATNEELETNNEELQATNEELEATNEELSARTQELQDLTRTLGNERVRLTEIVERAPFHVMVLRGPPLTIEVLNQRFARLLSGREWLNRPMEEVLRGPELTHLVDMAREAFWHDKSTQGARVSFSRGDTPGAGTTEMSVTVVPSHDSMGKVDGVVIFAAEP